MWDSTAWMKTTKTPRPMFQIDDNISGFPAVLRDQSPRQHGEHPTKRAALHLRIHPYAHTARQGYLDHPVRVVHRTRSQCGCNTPVTVRDQQWGASPGRPGQRRHWIR